MTEEPIKTETNSAGQAILRDELGRVLPGSGPINPTGRPKTKWLTQALREEFDARGIEGAKALIRTQVDMALSGEKGSDAVLRQMWDRLEGPVTHRTEASVDMRTLVVLEDANQEEPSMPPGLTAGDDVVREEEPDEDA